VKPDRTWSDWSEPLSAAAGSPISSPNARYIQWKVDLTGSSGATPILDSVTLAYLPRNLPPVVKSVNVVTQSAALGQTARSASGQSSSPFSVTVTDTDSSATSAGTPTQTLMRASSDQIVITWQAEDPDGDRLVYNLYYRGEDETQWKLLKASTHDTSMTMESQIFADGKYYFKVVASDREANPPSTAREAQLVGAPVMIDNTPPVVTFGAVRRDGARAHAEFEGADAASPLRRAEYSLDAASWTPLEAADGVIDSLRERFTLDLSDLAPGEHLLVVRVVDSAGNAGLAKVVLK
jgi:hypothetical protein